MKRHSLHIQPNLFQKKPQTLPLKQSWHTLDLANQYSPVFVFQKTYKFINSVPLDSLKDETKKKLSYLYLCYSIRVQEYLCSTKFTFNILANQNKITKYLSKLKREKTRVT